MMKMPGNVVIFLLSFLVVHMQAYLWQNLEGNSNCVDDIDSIKKQNNAQNRTDLSSLISIIRRIIIIRT